MALLGAPKASPSVVRKLSARPRFGLALFWGWQGLPRPTGPANANQRGWLYPAHGTQPAVIKVMIGGQEGARIVPTRVLRIFKSHGTPVRL